MTHNSNMLFGYPDMGRTGLAHSLLAWARCALWCRDTGATMLAPRWLRLRIGPYLRRERDKRNYFLLFHRGDYVGEPARTWILARAQRLYAELDLPDRSTSFGRPTVVIFRNAMMDNERKMFGAVAGQGAYLHEQLTKMTRPEYVPKSPPEPFIAAHVRMGDFVPVSVEQLKVGVKGRIPVEWFAGMIEQLRSQLGYDAPVVVFSDGTDEALEPLLRLPNTKRSEVQQAITDLLTMARSSALISSGSGFSLWGSFLGDVPRIVFPKQSLVANIPDEASVIECDGSEPLPAAFVTKLVQAGLTPKPH